MKHLKSFNEAVKKPATPSTPQIQVLNARLKPILKTLGLKFTYEPTYRHEKKHVGTPNIKNNFRNREVRTGNIIGEGHYYTIDCNFNAIKGSILQSMIIGYIYDATKDSVIYPLDVKSFYFAININNETLNIPDQLRLTDNIFEDVINLLITKFKKIGGEIESDTYQDPIKSGVNFGKVICDYLKLNLKSETVVIPSNIEQLTIKAISQSMIGMDHKSINKFYAYIKRNKKELYDKVMIHNPSTVTSSKLGEIGF